jgi:hypothetical protein
MSAFVGIADLFGPTLLPPEILESHGESFSVPHRTLDILVSEVGLQRPRVVALVGKRVAEHVRVRLEGELGRFPGPRDHFGEALQS